MHDTLDLRMHDILDSSATKEMWEDWTVTYVKKNNKLAILQENIWFKSYQRNEKA